MSAATITHAHAPQQHTDPESQREAAIDATFALGASTIGWTELETIDQVDDVHMRKGWDTYWPRANDDESPEIVTVAGGKRRPAAANAVTVSWREDVWEFVKGKSTQIHGGRANVSPSRFVTQVWLRNIATGITVRFVQSHWVSGIQPVFKEPADYRESSLRKSRNLLTAILAQGDAPTIASLDANHTRLPEFVKVDGLKWEKTGGTHGPRQIDWVGHRDVTPVQITRKSMRRRVLKFLDHKATVAHFSLVSTDDHQEPEMPTVLRVGTDSSGRSILMTPYMRDWWEQVKASLDFTPVIVQGAWMARNGGGAFASAGYHDLGGCLDIRTRDLTARQIDALNHAVRINGGAGWRRDREHGGMDPHYHLVLGTDEQLASGARAQWRAYINGLNGLASGGRDYEWRPSPLVLNPPRKDWFDMATENDLKQAVKEALAEMTFEVTGPDGKPTKKTLGQLLAREYKADTDQGKRIRNIDKNTKGA